MTDTSPEQALRQLWDAAHRSEPFMLAGRHYVPAEQLPATERETADLRWAVASMSAALERIRVLTVGDRHGIVSKGEIRDAF